MFPLTPSSSSVTSFLPSPNTLLTFSDSVYTTLPDPEAATRGESPASSQYESASASAAAIAFAAFAAAAFAFALATAPVADTCACVVAVLMVFPAVRVASEKPPTMDPPAEDRFAVTPPTRLKRSSMPLLAASTSARRARRNELCSRDASWR